MSDDERRIEELETELQNTKIKISTASLLLQQSAMGAYGNEANFHDHIEMIKDVLNAIDFTPEQVRKHSHNIEGLNKRIKEHEEEQERHANLRESFRIINEEYDEKSRRISEAVDEINRVWNDRVGENPLSTLESDVLAILKGGGKPEQQQDDRPRFKPGDKVWVLDGGKVKHTSISIVHWELKKTRYSTLKRHAIGRFAEYNEWSSSEVFATKQELIESL